MLLVLNWKMNPSSMAEAEAIFEVTKDSIKRGKKMKAVVAPPAFFLGPLATAFKSRSVALSAQTIHTEGGGAFTGDVSAKQAKSTGASYTLIGHAERRRAGETDDDVQKKVARALEAGLHPIICIGEEARDTAGIHFEAIKKQMAAALADVSKTQAKEIIIAYEPVWAIGADQPMSARDMHEMSLFIRKVLWEKYEKIGQTVPVLYGGAILDEAHAVKMAKESEVDGFLLGRMSIDREKLPILFAALSKI